MQVYIHNVLQIIFPLHRTKWSREFRRISEYRSEIYMITSETNLIVHNELIFFQSNTLSQKCVFYWIFTERYVYKKSQVISKIRNCPKLIKTRLMNKLMHDIFRLCTKIQNWFFGKISKKFCFSGRTYQWYINIGTWRNFLADYLTEYIVFL